MSVRSVWFIVALVFTAGQIRAEPTWAQRIVGESVDDLAAASFRPSDGTVLVCGQTSSLEFLNKRVPSEHGASRNGSFDAFIVALDATSGEVLAAAILSGSGDDIALSVASRPNGEVVAVGYTDSSDFPHDNAESPAGVNAWIATFSPDLSDLECVTLLGGSSEDRAAEVALSDSGDTAWVLGYTSSFDFPGLNERSFQSARPGGVFDLFLTEIDLASCGSVEERIRYSTYLGGRTDEPLDRGSVRGRLRALGLDVSNDGRVYISGRTDSDDFPVSPNARDQALNRRFSAAFVTVLNPAAPDFEDQLVYSTFLGGPSDASAATDVVVDSTGAAWVTGFTFDASFPTTPGAYERVYRSAYQGGANGFLSCIEPNDSLPPARQLPYSTLLTGATSASGCFLGRLGRVAVVGSTFEPDLPTTHDACQARRDGETDAFLTFLDLDRRGSSQGVFSTYFGGAQRDGGRGIAGDGEGNVFLCGYTRSFAHPWIPGELVGEEDAYCAAFALPPDVRFLRGDCNDDGEIDLSDAVCILNWLFLGGPEPGCITATNTNSDAGADIADPTYLLNHLFLGGPAPTAPFPDCGTSGVETDEGLGCEESSCP